MKNILKKLIGVSLIIGCVGAGVDGYCEATVIPTSANVTIDDSLVDFEAYNYLGNNYFKLRDIAYVLNEMTDVKFSIDWNENEKVITSNIGEKYIPIGNELSKSSPLDTNKLNYIDTTLKINDEIHNFKVCNVNGYNYFKLRDLGDVFDFRIIWDEANKTIEIRTKGRIVQNKYFKWAIDVGEAFNIDPIESKADFIYVDGALSPVIVYKYNGNEFMNNYGKYMPTVLNNLISDGYNYDEESGGKFIFTKRAYSITMNALPIAETNGIPILEITYLENKGWVDEEAIAAFDEIFKSYGYPTGK